MSVCECEGEKNKAWKHKKDGAWWCGKAFHPLTLARVVPFWHQFVVRADIQHVHQHLRHCEKTPQTHEMYLLHNPSIFFIKLINQLLNKLLIKKTNNKKKDKLWGFTIAWFSVAISHTVTILVIWQDINTIRSLIHIHRCVFKHKY